MATMTNQVPSLSHMGFAMLRMPLLPIRDWMTRPHISQEVPPQQALQLRANNARILFGRADVAEAIYIASAGFHARLSLWDWVVRDNGDQKMLQSFERYLNRMCFRSTPFGMFSTVSYLPLRGNAEWTIDQGAELASVDRASRLCGVMLNALCQRLNHQVDAASRYAVNASIYGLGRRYRYTDWKVGAQLDRHYDLAEIDRHPLIDQLIAQMGGRAMTVGEIERLCGDAADDIDVAQLVDDLIRAKVLLPQLSLDPLNADPTAALYALLEAHPEHAAVGQRLRQLDLRLKSVDADDPVGAYASIEEGIRELTGVAARHGAIQVDAFRKHDALVLDAGLVNDAVDALDFLLDRFHVRSNRLDQFCENFTRRYGSGVVPLMEALDGEAGIGLERNVLPNKLLQKLGIARRNSARTDPPPAAFDQFLLSLIQRNPGLLSGREIYFTRDDMLELPVSRAGEDGSGMHAVMNFNLMPGRDGARKRTAVLRNVSVTGAVNWVSRFCHGDERLHDASREYARQVEAVSTPQVIHAEISYLPAGRMANILTRPPIWRFRINLVDPACQASEFDIALSDLMLTVQGKEVQLWSRRLGKQVIPHLTSAHNVNMQLNLTVYKFLYALQLHGMRQPQLGWGGMFGDASYLPRLRFENLVLAPARWQLLPAALSKFAAQPGAKQEHFLRAMLDKMQVPRWIELEEGDKTLVLDRSDALDFAQLLKFAKEGRKLVLAEVMEEFDEAGLLDGCLSWRHEVLVPLRRAPGNTARRSARPSYQRDLQKVPFDEVIYVKLYGGAEAIDATVLPQVRGWLERQRQAGLLARWFFIRYRDSDWHLRLRMFPVKGKHAELLVRAAGMADAAQQEGDIISFEFAPYEREMIRYGGPGQIVAHEKLFCIDSELIVRMLDQAAFGGAPPTRWRMAMLAIDALLSDFGLEIAAKSALMNTMANNFKLEFQLTKQQTVMLGTEHRRDARELLAALRGTADAPGWALELRTLLETMSAARRGLARPLLTAPAPTQSELSMVSSHVHMLCNRLFADQGRQYEVVVYDYLVRSYRSLAALS